MVVVLMVLVVVDLVIYIHLKSVMVLSEQHQTLEMATSR